VTPPSVFNITGLSTLARTGMIYFLVDHDGECVYVGQSVNIKARLCLHRGQKQFRSAWKVNVAVKRLDAVESVFIAIFTPKYNIDSEGRLHLRNFSEGDVGYVVKRWFRDDWSLVPPLDVIMGRRPKKYLAGVGSCALAEGGRA
jgi:hypothetical protein